MISCRNQSCNVGDIRHEVRSDFMRDLCDAFKIDDPAVTGRSRHDQFRAVFFCLRRDVIIVDPTIRRRTVEDEVVEFAAEVYSGAMSQMQ